jgi:hypothetical protein
MLPPEFSYILGITSQGRSPAGSRVSPIGHDIGAPSFQRELKSMAAREDAVVKTPEKCASSKHKTRVAIGVDGAIQLWRARMARANLARAKRSR